MVVKSVKNYIRVSEYYILHENLNQSGLFSSDLSHQQGIYMCC